MISSVVFLAGFSALSMPLGSQNYAQFLTGIVCQRPNLGFCELSSTPRVSRLIETESSAPYRAGGAAAPLTLDLVEIGSLNAANTLRSTEPHTRMLRVLAPLLNQDVIASQIRMLFAISFVVVSMVFATASVLTRDEQRWFLLAIGFSLLLGDHLANTSSIAPIGLSTVGFVCSISVASSLLFSSKERFQGRKDLFRMFVVMLCGSLIVGSTRIDQFLLLIGLIAGALVHGFVRLKGSGATRAHFLERVLVLVVAFSPSAILVGLDGGASSLAPLHLVSEIGYAENIVDNAEVQEWANVIREYLFSPMYFALDLFPGFVVVPRIHNSLQMLYGIAGLSLIILILFHLARFRMSDFVLFIFFVGASYAVLYGAIIGPRAEFRYLWAAVIGTIFISSSSLRWSNSKARILKRSLLAGFSLGVVVNMLSIAKIFDHEKRFWLSESFSVSSFTIYGVVLTAFFAAVTIGRGWIRVND